MGVECIRSSPRKTGIQDDVLPSPASHSTFKSAPFWQVPRDETPGLLVSTENNLLEATALGDLPAGGELGRLIQLYFESVHRMNASYWR